MMKTQRKAIENRFEGKAAIVTGGSSGIGLAIVEELCREGASVTFTGNEDAGKEVEESLRKKGHKVQFLKGDMADEAFCERSVQAAVESWGRLDCLVNNAFSFLGKGVDVTREDLQLSYSVGPMAYASMVGHSCAPMEASGGGAVVNVSSISAHIAQPNRWTYNSAKGAVHMLTRCQALDLAPKGIRVNSISPAWIWTRETDKSSRLDGGGREKWEPIWGGFHMLERCGEPVECAGPVLFLLSDDASFITATDLPIDGGYLSMGPEGLGKLTVNTGSA